MSNWIGIKIKDLFASSSPGDWGSEGSPENGTAVLRSTNFRNDGSIDFSDIAYRTIDQRRLDKRRVDVGTILIEKSGGSPTQAAGRVVYCEREFKGTASNFIEVVKVKPNFDPKYVAYVLHHLYQSGLVLKYQQQTTGIINFKLNEYSEEIVNCASFKPEQTKLAEILSTVARAIEQTEASIAKQQRIKTGLMQDLLTRGIDEHGNLRSESTHKFKNSPLGKIPVEWNVEALESRASVKGGKRLPSGHAYAESETGYRYLQTTDFINRRLTYASLHNLFPKTFRTLERYEIHDGDVFISIAGVNLGVAGVFRPSLQDRVILTENAAKICISVDQIPEYISWQINGPVIQRQITAEKGIGAGVPKLALFRIQQLLMAFPEPKEQLEIVTRLQAHEDAIAKTSERLVKFSLLKTALMQDLLTGKKRVTSLLEQEVSQSSENPMAMNEKLAKDLKLDERNHVENPLLDQLDGLHWEVKDCDSKQQPGDTGRESFTEVVMFPVLREQLKVINPWLEDDQVEEVVKHLTASFPGTSLIQNNRHVFHLLLENTSVSENRKTGQKSPTVKFIDFNHRQNNRFVAVCQFKIRILGTEHHIIPDIVLFLNGLPVVVIECKSPKVKEPIPEAIDQLLRYSEQRGAKGEGCAPLFYFNQFVITTCRQDARFGTISTHNERHFYRWSDPYPRSLNDLEHGGSSPNDQQRIVAGMLDHNNLLDIIRNFTIFSTTDKGELIKIVGRYQQFRAVNLAVNKLLEGKNKRERSGIIWHTQGSGKSLTMMFMVRKMFRQPELASWKVIFITDRTQLESQLADTGHSVGFSVKPAESIEGLKALLATDSSDLVMAMIQKFREADLKESFPELNSSPNILVMTDEAHRTQYSLLGANLDRAIPNASRIGYTGTPLDKTEKLFGDYIDKYTMRQAIDDGVTLEIVYEGRTHRAGVIDKAGMDADFADVFSDYNLQERLQILGHGSRDAYLESDVTIKAKAHDMVRHYLTHVFPNGYKAQVVASSREAAVRYKKHLDDALSEAIAKPDTWNPGNVDMVLLKRVQTDVVISGNHNDELHLTQYSDPSKHKVTIKSFKLPFGSKDEGVTGDIGIIIVANMLLTGFDAPLEQVMYLDKIVVEHSLLQAIARVNRVSGDSKDRGFIVDYVGIGHHLKRAIDKYDDREQKEIIDTLATPEQELHELIDSHAAIKHFLEKHGMSDFHDHDAFFDLFYDEDVRFEFMTLFKAFTKHLNVLFPSKEALGFMGDYQTLAEINVLAGKHFHDERLSMKGVPPKLRKITDHYLESHGIDLKVPPISILDEGFQENVKTLSRTKTKAAAIEHAIRHHLDIELNDDPQLQASFAEALRAIFAEFGENWDRIFEELEKLRQKIAAAESEPTYGLSRKKQMPFFRMLKTELYGDQELDENGISSLVALTQHVFTEVRNEIELIGFWESTPARNKLKAGVQKILLSKEFSNISGMFAKRQAVMSRVMEIAEKNNDAILYAHE